MIGTLLFLTAKSIPQARMAMSFKPVTKALGKARRLRNYMTRTLSSNSKSQSPNKVSCFLVFVILNFCGCKVSERYDMANVQDACRRNDTNFFWRFLQQIDRPISGTVPGRNTYA